MKIKMKINEKIKTKMKKIKKTRLWEGLKILFKVGSRFVLLKGA